MLTYNTHLKPLILPEYGRVIQNMVDHCLTIENREERTRCAASIVKTMKTLFSGTTNKNAKDSEEDADKKLWDHLAIMSNFTLDIDWPFEPIRPDSIKPVPDPVEYLQTSAPDRQYGRTIQQMINAAVEMEEGEEREALVVLIANQMKKTLVSWDGDAPSDERIFTDLNIMSNGRITVDGDKVKLCEYKDVPKLTKKKKKK